MDAYITVETRHISEGGQEFIDAKMMGLGHGPTLGDLVTVTGRRWHITEVSSEASPSGKEIWQATARSFETWVPATDDTGNVLAVNYTNTPEPITPLPEVEELTLPT